MSDNNTATPGTESKDAKLVSAGKPVAFSPFKKPDANGAQQNSGQPNESGKQAEGAAAAASNNDGGAGGNNNAGAADNKNKPDAGAGSANTADIPEDQLKAFFEKQGIQYEGIDSLKAKLTTKAPETTSEPTPEQKEKLAQEKERRIFEKHTARKGTVEQLAAFKSILSADKKVLGMEKEITDLVAAGWSKEEATDLAKERYFQYTDEEINAITDPDDKKRHEKQREVGNKKLENKGAYIQKQSSDYLKILEDDLAEDDAEARFSDQHSSKVEDALKKYQRKQTLDIGKLGEQEVGSFDYEVSESILEQAKGMLKDRGALNKLLLTQDGQINVDFLLPHLVNSLSLQEAVKKTYQTAQSRAIDELKATFGEKPPTAGSAKTQKGDAGKVVSVGKPRVFVPVRK